MTADELAAHPAPSHTKTTSGGSRGSAAARLRRRELFAATSARLAGLAAVLASCATSCALETSVLLVVSGDLEPGVDADEISIRTFAWGREHSRSVHQLTEDAPLPQSLRIDAGEEIDTEVDVEVLARLDSDTQLIVTRRVTFSTGEQVTEDVCLFRACVGVTTPACLSGRCDPEE